MTKLSLLKYQAVHFLLTHIYLLTLISRILGSLDTFSEIKCEHEAANLIWRNTPAYSFDDVKAMAWYKGKDSLIATWMEGKGFVEYAPYIGRLMQIGETGIKIKTANRSDSGTYWLSLTLASVDHKLEAATSLEVKVAPSSECKPRITRAGSIMMAELPPEGCGTPYLTPKWKRTDMTVSQDLNNSSRLDLGSKPEPGEYMVCAEGESAKCYEGNMSDLCTKYNIWRDGPSDNLLTVILPGVLVSVLIITLLAVAIWFKGGVIRKRCRKKDETIKEDRNISSKEANTFNDFEMSTTDTVSKKSSTEVKPKTKFGKGLTNIQNHLKEMYDTMTNIPLSPFDDNISVNVTELYIKIHLEKVELADVDVCDSSSSSNMPRDRQPLISKDEDKQGNLFRPIFIFGDCGSGKTTWCKHLVQCWLQTSDENDANIQSLNLPDIRHFQILLYLPLQFSDNDLSFQELLEKYIFNDKSAYLEFVMNFVENSSRNVLIIMDGVDVNREQSKVISRLLHEKLVSSCTVIVTSRPSSLKMLYDTCDDKTEQLILFRIRKMDINDSKIYARRLVESINRLHGKNLIFENFWDFAEHLQVQSLLRVPYMCQLLMYIWMINKNNFIEVTDVLLEFINQYIRHALSDHSRKVRIDKSFGSKYMEVNKYITKLNKWPLLIKYSHLLYVLSRVAAAMLTSEVEKNNRELKLPKVFSITDEDRLDIEAVCKTGLLTELLSLSANKTVSSLLFSDIIICEFFVSVFVALQEGKDCDFIVSSGSSCLQNSMIIHMLFQLSNTVTKCILVKARKNLKTENTDYMSCDGSSHSNKSITYSITEKNFGIKPVSWLQWLMYKKEPNENKFLFLTTALHFIDSLISLVLEDHGNNVKLVFWLPFLKTLETLRLNINNCSLLLCKEWHAKTQSALKEVVIQSVHINKGSLELLIKSLSLSTSLERLEITPALPVTEHNDIIPETSELAHFTWIQLAQMIKENKKLKSLKLSNLSFIGEVDTVVSNLNLYANLEIVELSNLSNVTQHTSSLLNTPGLSRVKDTNHKLPDKINLKVLVLEKLTLLHSPINFMFRWTKNGETHIVKNYLKVLRLSAVDMPSVSWEKLGNQLGLLKLSEFHLLNVSPKGSAQILLDGIGKCDELEQISIINMDTGEIAPYFTFLKYLKGLSSLHIELMNFAGSSSTPLFEGIRECKKLTKLSFCKTTVGVIPEKVSFDLQHLSELTVDSVRITEEQESLYWLLEAFISCKNLKTLSLKDVKARDIPKELSNRKTLKIDIE
ncbi:hypothetical protein ACJMK2_042298 [Sinanodonta woodiana]|uniref:NACHT domain-containing protein n=1 Tax=Sinanodonta woodiana TaxID=1069815 RepID=A0ABD3W9Y7_SINWO